MLLCSTAPLCAQDAIRQKHFNTKNTLAIDGYDPVAYFSGKATKGLKSITYGGVVYYFSTVANFNLFKAAPANYEPQYGGWCAYAMGQKGEKFAINPKTFKIVNGKLYLFFSELFNNTLTDWNKNEKVLLQNANTYWKKMCS
jgi:YHS domain-containing protein